MPPLLKPQRAQTQNCLTAERSRSCCKETLIQTMKPSVHERILRIFLISTKIHQQVGALAQSPGLPAEHVLRPLEKVITVSLRYKFKDI
uniref:Uncharacterized protein n=1 Tax=Anguilla anguilla TaxID=7936 RepID=A0A0E9W4X6_ANGAN